MRITFTVGTTEQTVVTFTRGWFLGKVRIVANGKEVYANSVVDPATHCNLRLTRTYEVDVGEREPVKIQIVQTRPLLFAGLRPHKYEVFCNGNLIETRTGY